MRKALVGGVLLLLAMIYAWRDRAPEPAMVELPAPIIYPTPEPYVYEPLEPIPPHGRQRDTVWGPCAEVLSSRQRAEDAHLVKVLASKVEGDPLFGGPAWGMESAECAARRWRLADR